MRDPFRKSKLLLYGLILAVHAVLLAVFYFIFPPFNWFVWLSLIGQLILASTKMGEGFYGEEE